MSENIILTDINDNWAQGMLATLSSNNEYIINQIKTQSKRASYVPFFYSYLIGLRKLDMALGHNALKEFDSIIYGIH